MDLRSSEYRQLDQDDDDSEKSEPSVPSRKRSHLGKFFVIFHIILFTVYTTGIFLVWNREPSVKACNKKLSSHSPALPILTYLPPAHLDAEIDQKNKFRGPPSPEIDAEWVRIGLGTPAIRLFDSDLALLNKSTPEDPMRPLHRIPEEYGGGYIGMLEVFHLLHCLDSIRKATWPEYYRETWEKQGGERVVRVHNDHCIDMLREVIMCQADVTPITFFNNLHLPSRKLPMPDFNTIHTCRNFDAVLDWNNNNERTIQWDEIGLDLGKGEHVGRR